MPKKTAPEASVITAVGEVPLTARPCTVGAVPLLVHVAANEAPGAGGVAGLIVCAAGRPGLQSPARPGHVGRVVTPPARPIDADTGTRPEYITGIALIVSGPPPTHGALFG